MEARLGDFVNFTCDISTDTFLHRTFRHYMTNGVLRDFNTFFDGNDMSVIYIKCSSIMCIMLLSSTLQVL